ncbi:MAG: hypothetical protein Q9181_004153 [Wetmoreana brouardii]
MLLDNLSNLTYNPKSIVKTLISSRNDPDFANHFLKTRNLSIAAADNADDVMRFVSSQLDQRLLHGRASKQLKERVRNDLNQKANGVFRWVALQVDALCNPESVYSEEDVDYLLPKLPATLEDTYSWIVKDFDNFAPPSQQAIMNTIKLLICAEFPLSASDVLVALRILSGSAKVDLDESMILKMGRGLIVKESTDYHRLVFAHLSVKEFFEKRTEYGGPYAHAVAAEACLKFYLKPDTGCSTFRWYALTHLGRHCMKSMSLRQTTKLRDLMAEFLLAQDSSSAFERWNHDAFHSDLEMAPGTCDEKRRSQSLPALPLFMICVYGFDEFVVPTISKMDHVHYAENFYRERPLEVAALYGNYCTVKVLHEATSTLRKSPIRAQQFLVSAARSCRLDMWNFTLRHVSTIPFKSAIVEAARSEELGIELVSSLLNSAVDIGSEVPAEVFQNCASFDVLNLILARFPSRDFTEKTLDVAVQNDSINPRLVETILSKNPEIGVSENCILLGFHGAETKRAAIIQVLLAHQKRCEVSEALISEIATYNSNESGIQCLELLLEHCPIDYITEDWLVAAAENLISSSITLNFFLDHSLNSKSNRQNLHIAALSKAIPPENLEVLLSRSDCLRLPEESFYILTEFRSSASVVPTTIDRCGSIFITDAYLQACAAKYTGTEMRNIIYLPRAVPISEKVVEAALENYFYAEDVLKLLLQAHCGFTLEPSEKVLLKAVSENCRKYEIVHCLAEYWSTLPVTEASLMASVQKNTDGTLIFELLMKYWRSTETPLSDNVLLAAIQGLNVEFVRYFQQQRPYFVVKEEYLIAAMNLYDTNLAILRILLSQLGESPIPSRVLETAVEIGDQSIFELILEQPNVSQESLNAFRLDREAISNAEPDGNVTLDAIISAASKQGLQTELEYRQLGTTRLDQLLSGYSGPLLDSSRLVEVAAERSDGKFTIQYLLSRFPDTVVTRHALIAAARNEEALPSLLDLLLQHSNPLIDTELLRTAAANKYRGTQMIGLLLSKIPAETEIHRDVIGAALGNQYCGRSLFELIVQRQSHLVVTQELADAACENCVQGNVLLQQLLKYALASHSTESVDLVTNSMQSSANGVRDSLFMAACYGDDSILKVWISQGVSLATVSGELGTPLNVAVYAGQVHIVETLLANGSDPEFESSLYGTPLKSACRKGNAAIIRLLVRYGADIDRSEDKGRTALHSALRGGNHALVELLLSLKASVTKSDHQGMAAMHHASVFKDSAKSISKLICSGASVGEGDSQQWTPLHWAARSGGTETVIRLLEAGAAKNKVDASGRIPFHVALLCRNVHLRPHLYVSDDFTTDEEPTGKKYEYLVCDACDLVSL